MGLLTRYVNTDSTPGGDGTTNATAGANRAWASQSEAEAALDNAYNGDYVEVHCSAPSGTNDTTTVTHNGATFTDPDVDYIEYIGENTTAVWDDDIYSLEVEDSNCVNIWDDAIRFTKMQFYTYSPTAHRYMITVAAISASNNIQIQKCIIKSHGNNSYLGPGIHINDADAIVRIGNNLIYNGGQVVNYGNAAIYNQACSTTYIYYNTCADFTAALYNPSDDCVCKNNVFYNTSLNNIFGGGDFTGSDYNMSDDSSDCGGTNDETNQTFTFEGAGSGDFRLASGDSGAQNMGTDLSGDSDFPVSDDMIGTARSGSTPDCGFYEIPAAGGLSIPVAMHHYLRH